MPEFQHLTRGSFNKGYGYARIQPIWDAIVKLRERSDSEHFLKSVFLEVRFPQAWTANKKAKGFVDKVRKASRRRGIAIEAVTNPTTGEDTGLPSAVYRAWAAGADGQSYDKNQGSAYLDGEWLRLLVNLGYSQIWANGSNAGAMEGSEINLTMDDRADIAEFSYLSTIFKKMLKRLAELGVMAALGVSGESIKLLLEETYEIIPWLTWEYNDKSAAAMKREDEMMAKDQERGRSDDRNRENTKNLCLDCADNQGGFCMWEGVPVDLTDPVRSCDGYSPKKQKNDRNRENVKSLCDSCYNNFQDKCFQLGQIPSEEEKIDGPTTHCRYYSPRKKKNEAFRINETVQIHLEHCIKENKAMPMTPVASSWIKGIGFKDDYLYKETHSGHRYRKPRADAEQDWENWAMSDSKGGFWWDNLSDPNNRWEPVGRIPLPKLYGQDEYTRIAAEGKQWKEEGEVQTPSAGLEGAGETREPLKGYVKPGINITKPGSLTPTATSTTPSIYTPGRASDPASITGTKKTGPGRKRKRGKSKTRKPIVPYNYSGNSAIGLSFKKFNSLRKENKLRTIGQTKYQRWRKHEFKYNSIAVGDVMNFDIDLYYPGGIVERACKRDWNKIENHKGDLWLYEDQGHGGARIKVGDYDYKDGKTTFDYDDKVILENVPEDSNIARRINDGKAPEISTEYYCGSLVHNEISYQVDFHDALGRPRFDGIAIVDWGNCGAEACPVEVVA
jgi:hypothetical protein